MSWEVDLASHTERWVCSRCPFAHMARPLALGPEPSPALVAPLEHAANASAQAQLPLSPVLPGLARRIETTGTTEPADAPPAEAAPAAELGGVVQYAEAEPFAASTNSAVYVPLLLDAAGMLSAGARRAWHTHPTIGGWWPTAVNTLLARPFLPVPELAHAVEHVGQAFHPSSMRLSPSLRRFREWAALRHAQVTSLAELVRAIADPRDGHYLAAPLQEAFLTVLLGTSERLVDSLRRAPAAPPRVANTVGAAAASSTTGAPSRDDARTPDGAEPQAAAAIPEAGPPAQPPPDERGPRLALSHAEDDSAARPAQAPSAAAPADSEDPATAPSNVPAAAWAQLDGIDLQTEFAIRLPTMQSVPAFLRPGIRQAYTCSLRALRDAHSPAGEVQQARAWKLFLLVPRRLLCRARVTGSTGREALLQRVRDFLAGRWTALLAAARDAADQHGLAPTAHADDDDAASLRRREAACAHVRRGEVSRGRTVLTAAALAPGTENTFAALSDPARRPPALLTAIPADVRDLQPDVPATLTDAAVGQALRSSRRGTAAGLSGATCEHYKVLLDDAEALELFAHAANLLASAQIPANIAAALAVSPLQRCVSLPAGCVGSLLATRSAGSCRDAWHANMPTRLTRPPAHTSSPFRHVPALMLCLVCCVLPSTLMPTPRSSH